jgi:hypothetical protein
MSALLRLQIREWQEVHQAVLGLCSWCYRLLTTVAVVKHNIWAGSDMFQRLSINENQRRARGKAFLVCGCIWFTLAFFWLPPLVLILGWFRLPESFYAVLLPGEFVISAVMAATGVVLWNSAAKQRISAGVSLTAYSIATLAILATFNLYGWVHLTH